MKRFIWGTVWIVQCLVIGTSSVEINNRVNSRIALNNHEFRETNVEFIRGLGRTIMSRDKIFEFLKQQVPEAEIPKINELLNYISDKELRHIDFLIYLMSFYKNAAPYLLQSIYEILLEDERELQKVMSNFQQP